MADVLTRP